MAGFPRRLNRNSSSIRETAPEQFGRQPGIQSQNCTGRSQRRRVREEKKTRSVATGRGAGGNSPPRAAWGAAVGKVRNATRPPPRSRRSTLARRRGLAPGRDRRTGGSPGRRRAGGRPGKKSSRPRRVTRTRACTCNATRLRLSRAVQPTSPHATGESSSRSSWRRASATARSSAAKDGWHRLSNNGRTKRASGAGGSCGFLGCGGWLPGAGEDCSATGGRDVSNPVRRVRGASSSRPGRSVRRHC